MVKWWIVAPRAAGHSFMKLEISGVLSAPSR
jgi:hypothetical protein